MSIDKSLLESGGWLNLESGFNLLLESSETVNDIYLWRGAIEPAETSASGNEIQLWRGAVEPAKPAEAEASGLQLVSGVTRNVTQNVTRSVTG